MRDRTTTTMCYQVEGFGIVQESLCYSLKEARVIAKALKKKGCTDVQIARYDRSGKSTYYEVVEKL